jgi:hypothetical protein
VDDAQAIAAAVAGTPVGPYWDIVDAPSPFNPDEAIKLGVRTESFRIAQRTGTAIAQYLLMVRFGLNRTLHVFRGVERNMKHRDDMNADEKIAAYILRPSTDVEWVGDRFSGTIRKLPAPARRVFVVLTRPFESPDEYGVGGAILRWNWVDANEHFAPIDHTERYREMLWSKTI